MDLKLLVVQGKPEGKEIPIRVSKFIIGRSPECHLRPNSELISRHHCQFTVDGDEVRVCDLGSSNGTIVNGERLTEEVPINDGDLIQVGPLGFQVMIERDAAPVAAQAAPVQAAALAPVVTAQAGKLGSKEAKAGDIEQWLLSDSKNQVPDSGSGVYTGDTQMLQVSGLSGDTTPVAADTPTPPEGVEKLKDPEERVVQTEGGGKLKISGGKVKIEKTREDTSRAASDILRRMLERKPGK